METNSKAIRILRSFKRVNPIYYDLDETATAHYVILSYYSRHANHIASKEIKGITQCADICFKCEKDVTDAFLRALESYGIQYDDNVIPNRMERMKLASNQRDFFIELISDDEDIYFF